MSHKNQKLVPTAIVRSDGVLSTVYRSPVSNTTGAGRIPAPAAFRQETPDRWTANGSDLSGLLISKDLMPEDANAIGDFLTYLRSNHKEVFERVTDHLISGSETGRKMARRGFLLDIDSIISNHQLNQETDDDQLAELTYLTDRAWHCGNVYEEAGYDGTTVEALDNVAYSLHLLENYGHLGTDHDDIMFRGVTALAFSINPDEREDEFYEHGQDFAVFAGGHSDIGQVIRTAKERETIDVHKLVEVIEMKQEVPASLQSGVI